MVMYALFGFENTAEASNTLQKMISLFQQDRSRISSMHSPRATMHICGGRAAKFMGTGKKGDAGR
jgi:hypothetical protein